MVGPRAHDNIPFRNGRNRIGRPRRHSPNSKRPSIDVNDDVDCFEFDSSPGDSADKKCSRETNKPRKTKKRPRNKVLASISANNAKRMPIPIPTFTMLTKKNGKSDVQRSKKLSELERAFFDDDDGDDDASAGSQYKHDQGDTNGKTGEQQSGAAKYACEKTLPWTEMAKSSSPTKEDAKLSNSKDLDATETESEDSDFEGSFSSTVFVSRSKQQQVQTEEQPESLPADTSVEQQAKANSLQEDEIVEGDESANEDVHVPPPTGEGSGKKPAGNNSKNDGEHDDVMGGDDTNVVDFGGDDGDCDFEDITDGNCQEPPCTNGHDKNTMQTNSAAATSGPCAKQPAVTPCNNSVLPLVDLERQIDLLFLQTDTNTITMKMFIKSLESKIGASLDKATKKKAKSRVLLLLKGQISPSSDEGETLDICKGQDSIEDGDTKHDKADSMPKEDTMSEKGNNEDNDSNQNLNSKKEKNRGHETWDYTIPEKSNNEDHDSNQNLNSKKENDVDKKHKTNESSAIEALSNTETVCEVGGIEGKRISNSSKNDEAQKEPVIISQKEPAVISRESNVGKEEDGLDRQKMNARIPPQDLTSNQTSSLYCMEIEEEKVSNPEPVNHAKSKTKSSKPKRQRKPKAKPVEDGETPADIGATAIPPKKVGRTRKRTRKAAACALCKTCPCQRAHISTDCENIATLDLKKFSRSEEAIEKTLLRRLQKLEKSTESMEEQTEIVRRRWKKHVRDMKIRKRREQAISNSAVATGGETADSYFLPDAEVFEREQNEGRGMPKKAVEKAQTKVFQSVPTYQPTLFEMMGIPRDGDETKQKDDSEVTVNRVDQHDNNAGTVGDERSLLDGEDIDDDDIPKEYVPEQECDDRLHRLEWNNAARDTTDKESGIPSGSIVDTILQMTQEQHDNTDGANTTDGNQFSLWDDLFESKKKRGEKPKANTEAGLDDLLSLFEDGETDSNNQDADSSNVQTSKDEECRIDMSWLSQDAQKVANEVISGITAREKTASTLEASCPNWKENVCFALIQKDPSEIEAAIENVQQSRMRLQAQKEQILKAWERKNAALEVFETALKTSFDRLNSNSSSALQE